MYRFLPAPLLAALLLGGITVSTIVFGFPVFALAIVKFAVPSTAWREFWTRPLVVVAEAWIRLNNVMISATLPTRFEWRGLDDPRLRRDGRYLVISNHQTWSDILVLQRMLIEDAPFLRFFIKQELIWMPILGIAWWALDMPFMKRYSPEYLRRHPELRGKDIETTRRACEKFRRGPISIMNFAEGTRFDPKKRDTMESPYRYLLKPKAGGIAAALDAFSGDLDTLIDVTLAYSKPNTDFGDFLAGRVGRIVGEVRVEAIPPDVRVGNYMDDADYRERVQTWLREIWERKDARLAELNAEVRGETSLAGAAALGS